MALTVKHSKTSTIPDAGDTSLVQPSDWNADHTLTGTVPVANGGTGATTANDGLNALLPSQTGNNGKVLSTDGTNTTWTAVGGSGTVTSVGMTTPTGLAVTGSPITTSGTLALAYQSGYSIPTTAKQTTWDTALQTVTSTDGSVAVTQVGTNADLSVTVAGSTQNVICQIRNTTGATLTKGTAVYISGATGQIPTVSKALATSDATSAQTLGLLSADLANNTNGYVTIIGLITNIDTSAYTDGAQLYLSSTTAGALTATKQYAPAHLVYVAVVEHAHPTQGKLFVKVQNGYELDELHNVSAQTPSNGNTLIWNNSTQLWQSSGITAGSGVSVTNGAGSITIANTAPDQTVSLTAGSNVTITGTYPNFTIASSGGSTSPAGSNTQIQFNNSGAFGASSALTWDGTTQKATNFEATGGVLADGAFSGTYVDGIVVDYDTVGASGRISVGGADSLKFYNGGVAGSLLGSVNNLGDWSISRFLDVGNGTLIGGSTNPIIAAAGSANQYVQAYIHNDLAGTSASSDFAAYPDNGTDASGWIDMGITSSTYNDVNYPITGANEGYIFMSAPSGASKTGNLVYATDSTGSSNAHQFYVGGFGAAKTAWKMQLGASGFDLKTTVLLNSSAGTSGQVLTSAGSGSIPTWTTPTTGTVTSVSALTLGTTGTDLSSSVATGTTTPVITLNVPTASATNRGALSSTDWSTFNGKQDTLVSGTNIKTINGSSVLGSGNLAITASAGGANTQVQYNSAGALTGSANLTFDGTTLTAAGLSGPYNGTVGATTPTTGTFTSVTLSAGTASVFPMKFTAGTNLTTAAAGAMEYDGTVPYFSMAASSRGVIHNEQLVVLGTAYTLTSQTAAQKLFNATTNGALTLPIGTYQFECAYSLSAMSATSGSFGFALGVGTAIIGSQGWTAYAVKPASLTTASTLQVTYNTAANTTLATASINTVGHAFIKGFFRVTTAGTVIPQVSLGVAAAAVVGVQSYFKVSPISPTATAATNFAIGNWS